MSHVKALFEKTHGVTAEEWLQRNASSHTMASAAEFIGYATPAQVKMIAGRFVPPLEFARDRRGNKPASDAAQRRLYKEGCNARNADLPCSPPDLLTWAERHYWMAGWNDTDIALGQRRA